MSARGVKRGGQAHNIYLARKAAAEEEREHDHWWSCRQFCLDAMVISLGQMLEETMSQEEIWDFMDKISDIYLETERDIATVVAGEADEENRQRDKIGMTWVSKDRIDKALKEYVRPDEFKTFDERYFEMPPPWYTNKDGMILSLKNLCQKKDDEITKLKAQLKLQKLAKENRNNGK